MALVQHDYRSGSGLTQPASGEPKSFASQQAYADWLLQQQGAQARGQQCRPMAYDDYSLKGQGRAGADDARQAWLDYQAAMGAGNLQLGRLKSQMLGDYSVSAEQLRQGLQQNVAAQQAMAAGAAPRNQAMAARTAMLQSGRLGAGLAGQQATAGLQERQQAAQQYQALLNAMMASSGATYGTATGNAIRAYGGAPQEKGWWEEYGPAVTAAGTVAATALSDRRAKTNIEPGDERANDAMRKLPAFAYRYKDEANGAGTQLGPMAQDLERAGLKHTVIDTPRGKMVDTRKLTLANTAMASSLARRLAKLEGEAK